MKKTSPDIPLSNRKTLKPKLGNVIKTRYVAPSQFYSFWDQRTQNWLKNEHFEKIKKNIPRYSPGDAEKPKCVDFGLNE